MWREAFTPTTKFTIADSGRIVRLCGNPPLYRKSVAQTLPVVSMKFRLLALCALLSGSLPANSQTIQVGYTLVTATGGTGVPASSALFTFENSGVLVSQAGVPATAPMLSGRIVVDEVVTQTALALVNPSIASASISGSPM